MLYLVFNEGYSGDVDLAAEAIRLTRMLTRASDEPEVAGLLALMLLHHARRAARWTDDGALVPLADQDRSRWDTALIAEGVEILQTALARDRLGEYQAQAAIAALHCDARSAEETDWTQVLEWYDELLALTDSPVVALNRAVAVGEVDGPLAGLRELRSRARRRTPPDRGATRGCTSARATSPRRTTSTPRRPPPRPARPSATTSPARLPGCGQPEREEQLVARVRQAAPGQLLDLLGPVDHRVAVAVERLGRVLGRAVVLEQRGQRLAQGLGDVRRLGEDRRDRLLDQQRRDLR